jgi:hypothetical protein
MQPRGGRASRPSCAGHCLTGEDARPPFTVIRFMLYPLELKSLRMTPAEITPLRGYVCYHYFLPPEFDATLHKSLHSELQQMLLSSTPTSKTETAMG